MLSEISGFIHWVRMRSPQAKTWRDYRCDLELFASIVGDGNAAEILPQDVDRFVNYQIEQSFKPSTVNRRLAAVASFYRYLVKEGQAKTCPVLARRHYLRQPQRLKTGASRLSPFACLFRASGAVSREPLADDVRRDDHPLGKEVFARFIHDTKRAAGPFVAINCAAIPENMLEAVLFGYEKGAFTGAVQSHAGKFEQAQGGTLLLDEISEMDSALQAKLLRVLQEKEVERLGGRKTITLDVRVLATSNRNLREQVASGVFREDLYYRLSVFPLHIPPLRERVCDIIPIAERFLNKHNADLYLSSLAQQKLNYRYA